MIIVLKESLLVVITGCIPALLVQYREGFTKLKDFVSSAVVPEYLFNYFLVFFLIHLVASLFLCLYGYRFCPDTQRAYKEKIKYIGAIGDATLGIYRLASGLLFAIPIIWRLVEPNTLNNLQLFGLLSYALLFLVGVIAISSVNAWANRI